VPAPARALLSTLVALAVDALLFGAALGGTRPLLAHPRALALLGVWAVGNFVLAWKRPVGRQDAVDVRPDARFVLLALVLLPLLAPPLAALGERLGIAAPPWSGWPLLAAGIAWGGIALAAVGLAIRIAAMTRLGARFSPRIAIQREHALETTGLYAKIRHPGYLGSLLATAGGVLAFDSMLGWPLFLLMAVAQITRARREEALLEARFGDAYRAYMKCAGGFLPKLGGG